MFRTISFVVVLLAVLVPQFEAIAQEPCTPEELSQDWVTEYNNAMGAYDVITDEIRADMGVPGMLDTLEQYQDLRAETYAIEVPACALEIKMASLEFMTSQIDRLVSLLLLYLRATDDDITKARFDLLSEYHESLYDGLSEIRDISMGRD